MVDLALAPRSPLIGATQQGAPGPEAAVTLRERAPGRFIALLARRGQGGALQAQAKAFGLSLPTTPLRVEGRGHAVVWTGPDRWLLEVEGAEAGPLLRNLAALPALVTTVEVEDARVVVAVGGPRAPEALAKILTLDLHPRAFPPGTAAVTVAGGISVVLWLRSEAPVYDCAVPRSMARSFWAWLEEAAAEYANPAT